QDRASHVAEANHHQSDHDALRPPDAPVLRPSPVAGGARSSVQPSERSLPVPKVPGSCSARAIVTTGPERLESALFRERGIDGGDDGNQEGGPQEQGACP